MVRARRQRHGADAAARCAAEPAHASLGTSVLLLACLCALALLVAPPLLGAAGWPYADAVRWLLHSVCHQLPERSFHLLGEPLAVCHRCTGLYLGFALGVAAWPLLPALSARLAARPRCIVLFAVPLAIDWLIGNSAGSRFATGMVAAFPVGLLPLLALNQHGSRRLPPNHPDHPNYPDHRRGETQQ